MKRILMYDLLEHNRVSMSHGEFVLDRENNTLVNINDSNDIWQQTCIQVGKSSYPGGAPMQEVFRKFRSMNGEECWVDCSYGIGLCLATDEP